MKPGNVQVSVATIQVAEDGAALRGVSPDQSGLYRDFPLCVLGKKSRNGESYDPKSAQEAMTSSRSRFALNVKEGNQEGEFGHPFADKKDLRRMVYIDRTRVSHYIRGVKFRQTSEGNVVVYGDIGVTGPYGESLKDTLEDPNRNTAFSLRALTQKMQDGTRCVKVMVTFDAVDGPGFEEASKRYMGAQEDISVEQLMDDDIKDQLFSTEDITDQEILDIFQTSQVRVFNRDYTEFDPENGTLSQPGQNGDRKISARHAVMRGI